MRRTGRFEVFLLAAWGCGASLNPIPYGAEVGRFLTAAVGRSPSDKIWASNPAVPSGLWAVWSSRSMGSHPWL